MLHVVKSIKVGDRVRILDSHGLAGKTGQVLEYDHKPTRSRWTGLILPPFVVRLDDFGHTHADFDDLELMPGD